MINKQNLHTHTTFCDGRDTPAELIQEAMQRGFDSLGFSIHSYVSASPLKTMDRFEPYKTEIKRLKSEYEGRFDIFCGVEYDYYSSSSHEGYDYTLGAVHYLKTKNGIAGFDRKADYVKNFIEENFEGDGYKFAKCYYETLAELPRVANFDAIAHFDIVIKNNQILNFLDEDDPRYLSYAYEAADALKGKIPFFELNTGAIARGYRNCPYPTVNILKKLKENSFGVILGSDCHNKIYLDYAFEDAKALLSSVGFKSRFILTKTGYKEVEL